METPQTQTEIIEIPESIAEAVNETGRDRAALHVADRENQLAAASLIAISINDSRPEGMPSTIPTSKVPARTELTASTVRSPRR